MRNALYDGLKAYADSDYYGFHMPGHKRNNVTGAGLPYEIDITEIEGFDDLHHAKGILRQAQERAARVFHAEESCILVNGSTAGILSAVFGCTQHGGRILMARNCHRSAYHAVQMNGLEPIYLYPTFQKEYGLNGAVDPEEVRKILAQDAADTGTANIQAVVITSPTYDGILSDIERIAEIAHMYKIPLIVDEAHGAHFGFHPYFPENANTKGADVVIHSIHKTLPSLTQTALLHMNGAYADRGRIKNYLSMLQTSSPSYVLMASADACIGLLDSGEGTRLFEDYVKLLHKTREQLRKLRHLRLAEPLGYPLSDEVGASRRDMHGRMPLGYDRSKIIVSVKGTRYSGKELYFRLLEEYHLQMEMAAGSYVLAMTSPADTEEGVARLVDAFLEIDEGLGEEAGPSYDRRESVEENGLPRLERIYSPAEMEALAHEAYTAGRTDCIQGVSQSDPESGIVRAVSLPWDQCTGLVSMEYAYLYPPGIPLVVPGEKISQEAARLLEEYQKMGFQIEGIKQDGYIEGIFGRKKG